MSDLAATNCGCSNDNGCGCNNIIWIILLLCCCGGGCGNGNGSFLGGNGCRSKQSGSSSTLCLLWRIRWKQQWKRLWLLLNLKSRRRQRLRFLFFSDSFLSATPSPSSVPRSSFFRRQSSSISYTLLPS